MFKQTEANMLELIPTEINLLQSRIILREDKTLWYVIEIFIRAFWTIDKQVLVLTGTKFLLELFRDNSATIRNFLTYKKRKLRYDNPQNSADYIDLGDVKNFEL